MKGRRIFDIDVSDLFFLPLSYFYFQTVKMMSLYQMYVPHREPSVVSYTLILNLIETKENLGVSGHRLSSKAVSLTSPFNF